jgi:radical SAM superfamily enzyme YgiQ (UPF0313 family)
VISEISELIQRYNVDSIDFLDENFCWSRSRVEQLCEALLQKSSPISWGTAARVDNVDAHLLKLMRRAGCVFVLYGFESGSQEILNKMGKGITVEQAWDTFVATEEAGIDAHGNLIIGHPGETTSTLEDSLRFQRQRFRHLLTRSADVTVEQRRSIEERFATVSFCTPYPGTPLFDDHHTEIGDVTRFLNLLTHKDAKELTVNISGMPEAALHEYQRILSSASTW